MPRAADRKKQGKRAREARPLRDSAAEEPEKKKNRPDTPTAPPAPTTPTTPARCPEEASGAPGCPDTPAAGAAPEEDDIVLMELDAPKPLQKDTEAAPAPPRAPPAPPAPPAPKATPPPPPPPPTPAMLAKGKAALPEVDVLQGSPDSLDVTMQEGTPPGTRCVSQQTTPSVQPACGGVGELAAKLEERLALAEGHAKAVEAEMAERTAQLHSLHRVAEQQHADACRQREVAQQKHDMELHHAHALIAQQGSVIQGSLCTLVAQDSAAARSHATLERALRDLTDVVHRLPAALQSGCGGVGGGVPAVAPVLPAHAPPGARPLQPSEGHISQMHKKPVPFVSRASTPPGRVQAASARPSYGRQGGGGGGGLDFYSSGSAGAGCGGGVLR